MTGRRSGARLVAKVSAWGSNFRSPCGAASTLRRGACLTFTAAARSVAGPDTTAKLRASLSRCGTPRRRVRAVEICQLSGSDLPLRCTGHEPRPGATCSDRADLLLTLADFHPGRWIGPQLLGKTGVALPRAGPPSGRDRASKRTWRQSESRLNSGARRPDEGCARGRREGCVAHSRLRRWARWRAGRSGCR